MLFLAPFWAFSQVNSSLGLEDQMDNAYEKFLRGEYRAAIQDFNKIIALHKTHPEAFFLRGLCFSNLRDEGEAIKDFTKALELNPTYKEALVERAYSKTNIDDFDGALSDYAAALKIDPGYAEVYFNRGTLYYELDQDDKACIDWKKAYELGIKVAKEVLEQFCTECAAELDK